MVVVVVRDDREGVRRNGLDRNAGRSHATGNEGPRTEMGVGEEDGVAIVHRERRVSDPGDGRGMLDIGEIGPVVGNLWYFRRAALVVRVVAE
jgi:hypothetical protein